MFHVFVAVEVPFLDVTEHKTLEDPLLVQPHSALSGDQHPMSSTLGVGSEASFHPYQHGTRTPDAKGDFERSKNSRLDLPAPNEFGRSIDFEDDGVGRILHAVLKKTPGCIYSVDCLASSPSFLCQSFVQTAKRSTFCWCEI